MADNRSDAEHRVLIALVNHRWSHPNLGVSALSEMSTELLRRAARVSGRRAEFLAVEPGVGGLPPDVARAASRVTLKPWLAVQYWFRLVRLFRRVDLIVDIGEGDGFAGIYGPRRFLWQLFPKSAALASRKPLVLAPQTFGPFKGRWQRMVFDRVCRGAAICAARDEVSKELALGAGADVQVELVSDVAFSLPFEAREMSKSDARIQVGLNVSGLLWSATSNDSFFVPGYRRTIETLLDQLLHMPSVRVHMIPHVGGAELADVELPDRVAACEALGNRQGAVVVDDPSSASAAKSYIHMMDFFIGSRMHACIAAASGGVPLCALSYSRKFVDTFGTVGLNPVLDPRSGEPDEVVAEIVRRLGARHDQGELLTQARRRADELTERYVERLSAVIGEAH